MADIREVLTRLSQRARMQDLSYFVGRNVERNLLRWSPNEQPNNRVCWLHGPPRVGKSSLAHAIGVDAASGGAKVIWSDLIDAPNDFQGSFDVIVEEATRMGISVPSADSPAKRIERLVQKRDRPPILFIIDECDRLAVQMSTDEQAFIRRLVETTKQLAFLFISRVNPQRIVEEVTDARSRLLGITLFRYLGALSRIEVLSLYQMIAKDLNCPLFAQAGRLAWERVGGHPLCVISLAQELVARIDHIGSKADLLGVIDDTRESIEPLLESLWPELKHGTRIWLLQSASAEWERSQQDAKADGYLGKGQDRAFIRPSWLVAHGERVGIMPRTYGSHHGGRNGGEAIGLRQRMNELLYEINRMARMRSEGQPWFEPNEEWLRFHLASRAIPDERSFVDVIEHLYRTCYSSARVSASGEWRIPVIIRDTYLGSRGIVVLTQIRDAMCSQLNQGILWSDATQYRHVKAYFHRIVGKEVPQHSAEWCTLRDRVLLEICEALQTLLIVADARQQDSRNSTKSHEVRGPNMSLSQSILDDLRNAYNEKRLIIFAGAGISAAAGLPTWPSLTNQLRDRLQMEKQPSAEIMDEIDDYIKRHQFIDALFAIKHTLGENEFNLAIEKGVDDSKVQIPEVAKAIAELEPMLRAVITTNLDRFLERAFGGNWEDVVSITGDLAQRSRYILKLHGNRNDRRSWVFTREQYDQATFGWKPHRRAFELIFNAYPILFVGYGLADDDFDVTLSTTRALAGDQPPTHYALIQGPIQPYRRKKLEAAGIRLLEYQDHSDVPAILRMIR